MTIDMTLRKDIGEDFKLLEQLAKQEPDKI
jgi:hypothetical protein